MQIIADLHTHTSVTDHAFSTLTEMVQAAEDRGLAAIAITNHGPTNPDGPHEWHFSNLNLIHVIRYLGGKGCIIVSSLIGFGIHSCFIFYLFIS